MKLWHYFLHDWILVDLTQVSEPLADYLNNHTKFQILQEEVSTGENVKSVGLEESNSSSNDSRKKLTIRQFIKDYVDQKSKNSIVKKLGLDLPSFGKISPDLPNLPHNRVETVESSEVDKELGNGKSLFNNPLISKENLQDRNGFQYDPNIINNIHRFGNSDCWFVIIVTLRDDKFGMMRHPCKHKDKSEAC